MRIITWSENQNEQTKSTELLKTLKNVYKKLHKSKRHGNFLEKCIAHRVTPNFIKLPVTAYKHLSKKETKKIEKREIEKELNIQKNKMSNLENEFENKLLTFKLTFNNNYEYEISLQNLKSSVQRSEKYSDEKRDKKLKALLNVRFSEFSKVEIYNLSTTLIPDEVKSILQLGKSLAIGGSPRGSNNFVAIENLFNSFQKYGRNNKIGEKILEEIHAHTILKGLDLEKSFTSDPRAHKLSNFLRENKHLVLLNVDKSRMFY